MNFNLIKRIIDSAEDKEIPLGYYFYSFVFIITLRNFLEIFSDKFLPLTFTNILHYDLSYAVLALAMILLIEKATGEDIESITRIALISFVVLNIVPFADLLISLGKGFDIAYLRPKDLSDLVGKFFTFFGSFGEKGISPGIRIEVSLVLLGSFIYIYEKRKSVINSLFYTLIVYCTLFIYLSFPYFIKRSLSFLRLDFSESNTQYIHFYLLIFIFLGLRYLFIKERKLFLIIFKDIRPLRIIHYLLMFVFGIVLGSKFCTLTIDDEFPLSIIFILAAIILVWIYSVMKNNISDVKIDSVSNPKRPLSSCLIDVQKYEYTANLIFPAALLFAGVSGFTFFFFILLFGGNYYLYSMKPLRIKRVPVLSKLVISGNSLILIMMGFWFVTGGLEFFPLRIILFFLVPFTLAINFIDIKDYEGDKREGIRTIPVILGLKWGKFIISLFFAITYLWSYFLIKKSIVIPFLILFSITQFILINRKNYKEKYVFVVYLFSLSGGLASLLFLKIPLT